MEPLGQDPVRYRRPGRLVSVVAVDAAAAADTVETVLVLAAVRLSNQFPS